MSNLIQIKGKEITTESYDLPQLKDRELAFDKNTDTLYIGKETEDENGNIVKKNVGFSGGDLGNIVIFDEDVFDVSEIPPLPIASGGTSATNVEDALTNFGIENAVIYTGISKETETIPLTIGGGGTGANNVRDARTNLGLSGTTTETLLWENASPTSEFGGQYLNINWAEYDLIRVSVRVYGSSVNNGNIEVTFKSALNCGGCLNIATLINRARVISITENNKIHIANAYKWVAYGTSADADSTWLIPEFIYGIKVVK